MWNTQCEVLHLARQCPNFQQCMKRKVPPGSDWHTHSWLLLSLPLGGLSSSPHARGKTSEDIQQAKWRHLCPGSMNVLPREQQTHLDQRIYALLLAFFSYGHCSYCHILSFNLFVSFLCKLWATWWSINLYKLVSCVPVHQGINSSISLSEQWNRIL